MVDMLKRLPTGTGKAVNKKQMQDFIKELLFEKSPDDVADLLQNSCAALPSASAVIVQMLSEAGKSGDFSKLKPMLDFAFDGNLKVKK